MSTSPREEILAQERRALDQWSSGRASGYIEIDADDVTYFDDIGAHGRIEGIDALRQYFAGLDGQIPPHEYEMADPHVQVYGDTGILSFRYELTMEDGSAGQPWKASSVYHRIGDEWRIVHAHWSLVKEADDAA